MPSAHADVVKVLLYNCSMLINFSCNIFKKLSICLSFFLCYFTSTMAQYSYSFKAKADIPMGFSSAIVLGSSLYFQEKVKPLTVQQIALLDRSNVNRFDRYACSQWNPSVAKGSDIVAIGSVLLPAYFAFNNNSKKDFIPIANVTIQSLLLSQSIANLTKFSKRNRPFLYNNEVGIEHKIKPDARMSFFSAHTTTVSATCFSFAFAHSTYYKDSKANPYIWSAACVLPAIEGFLRVKAGKHYPTDVIVGYLAGLGSSWLMHKMHLIQ